MTATAKRRPGRPRVRIADEQRASDYVGFRCPRELKGWLTDAAANSGRSLSTEAQVRLEQSFLEGAALRLAYGPEGAELLNILGQLLRHGPGARGADIQSNWPSDPIAYSVIEREITHALKRLRPLGDQLPETDKSPEERADRLLVALDKIPVPEEWKEDIGP
jgi:hypothetical protein